jgi:hypothetical protein
MVGGAVCYQTTTDAYDGAIAEAWTEAADAAPERLQARASADQALGLLAARKKLHGARRPTIIAILGEAALARFLREGVGRRPAGARAHAPALPRRPRGPRRRRSRT